MSDENSVNAFILYRAQGLSLDEIGAKTGLPGPLLEDWETEYAGEVKRVKDSVLEKVAIYIFEDLKRQLALLDTCLTDIAEKALRLNFYPNNAERAYSSIAQLTNARTKMISEAVTLLLDHEKRRLRRNSTSKNVPMNIGASDGIL